VKEFITIERWCQELLDTIGQKNSEDTICNGAVLNWFDITELERRFSLNDKLGDIIKTFRGKIWFAVLSLQLAKKPSCPKQKSAKHGTKKSKTLKMNSGLMNMFGSFTVLRLTSMLVMRNISFTKEISYEGVFLANDKMIAKESETLAAFLRASARGFADMKANPEEALAILLANQNEENFPLSETVERQSMAVLLPLMENENAAFLSQSDECWQENIDWMRAQGLIDGEVSVDDVRVELAD